MESADRFVFLVGPPGSGKTLLLGLKAEEWARAGCNVVIVRATGDDDDDDVMTTTTVMTMWWWWW